jgi:hypothetical protein
MSHPNTHALATLLSSQPEDYETTASAIESLFAGFTDEQKADLYALLQERANATMSFVELSDSVNYCLLHNEEHFRG